MIEFTVKGDPTGKGRPRAVRTKTSVRAYTPKKTANYEKLVQRAFKEQCPTAEPIAENAVYVQIHAYFGIPKSTAKANRHLMELGSIMPTKKPDADNIAKIICDSLNGLAYKDDSQVCFLSVGKHYTVYEPRVSVKIWDMQEDEDETERDIDEVRD